MKWRTHPRFTSLLKRIDNEYKKTGDLIRIGHMMSEYNGPVTMGEESTMSRFDYVKYDGQAELSQTELKAGIANVEALVERHLPSASRSKALIMTKLEEAYMWMGKAIRDDQIARNGTAPLMEERKNG